MAKRKHKVEPLPWIYNGQSFTESPDDFFGFVYVISNLITGEKYIGKRLFSKAGYKQIKGKRKKIRKENQWQDYFGSGPQIIENVKKYGKENFSREILRLCQSRGECNYWELSEIMSRHALRNPIYLNFWWKGTVSRKHLMLEYNDAYTKS